MGEAIGGVGKLQRPPHWFDYNEMAHGFSESVTSHMDDRFHMTKTNGAVHPWSPSRFD